jgi:hypothetical protein
MSLTKQKRKTLQRSRNEKGPYVSGYCNGGLNKPHGAWMSLVATAGTSGFAGTSAHPGSGQIEDGVLKGGQAAFQPVPLLLPCESHGQVIRGDNTQNGHDPRQPNDSDSIHFEALDQLGVLIGQCVDQLRGLQHLIVQVR